jgi:hypothetical protein
MESNKARQEEEEADRIVHDGEEAADWVVVS